MKCALGHAAYRPIPAVLSVSASSGIERRRIVAKGKSPAVRVKETVFPYSCNIESKPVSAMISLDITSYEPGGGPFGNNQPNICYSEVLYRHTF